jgi:hypothetical protein
MKYVLIPELNRATVEHELRPRDISTITVLYISTIRDALVHMFGPQNVLVQRMDTKRLEQTKVDQKRAMAEQRLIEEKRLLERQKQAEERRRIADAEEKNRIARQKRLDIADQKRRIGERASSSADSNTASSNNSNTVASSTSGSGGSTSQGTDADSDAGNGSNNDNIGNQNDDHNNKGSGISDSSDVGLPIADAPVTSAANSSANSLPDIYVSSTRQIDSCSPVADSSKSLNLSGDEHARYVTDDIDVPITTAFRHSRL